MPEVLATLTALAAVAAIGGLILTAIRLKRSRRDFEEEVKAWKLRLELDLQRATRERNRLLDDLAEAFLLLDHQGEIVFANRSARELFQGRNLDGRRISDTILDRRILEVIERTLATGEGEITRVVLPQQASPRGDSEGRGTNAWIIDALRVSDSPTEAPTTRVLIRDVTAEHQTDQVRKDFVANASHELRTPLAIINGYLENLLEDDLVEDPDITRRFLKVMRKHTERIARIVEDMLVISRLESGEAAALRLRSFRLRSCCNDVLERLESMIRAQSATVEVTMSDDELELVGDRFYWTQILFNLVENALKQNPKPGLKVFVKARRDGAGTVVEVGDNGVGIPSADLPHIFRRFYRVEKHHSQDEIKGTGLGLSIVRRAVEAHGGTIEVSSTPGRRTCFTMKAPHLEAPQDDPERRPSDDAAEKSGAAD